MCLLEKGLRLPSKRQEQKLCSVSFHLLLISRSAATEDCQAEVVLDYRWGAAVAQTQCRSRKLRVQDARLEPELSHHGETTTLSPAPFVGDCVGPWKVASFHMALFLDCPFFFHPLSELNERRCIKAVLIKAPWHSHFHSLLRTCVCISCMLFSVLMNLY